MNRQHKNKNTRILSALSAAVLIIGLTTFNCMRSEEPPVKQQEQREVASFTVTPATPSAVIFCGETIDMRRYNRHESLDRELTSFTYLHASTMLLFKRANRFFPIIEPILKANNIPDDFKYLAVIESMLDPRVSSPARAVGLWQFLESTGRQYGLHITSTVDERCNVEKATVAACKYLREAYTKYGNWLSVASSYNAGMGRISNEINRQEGETSLDLWLVEETTRYPYRIIAIKQIFENPYRYGFLLRPKDLYKPVRTRAVEVRTDVADLAAFASKQGITYADLKRFNPWLRDRKLLTGGRKYSILIPLPEDMLYEQPNSYVHDTRWITN